MLRASGLKGFFTAIFGPIVSLLLVANPLAGSAAEGEPNRIFVENTVPYFVVGTPGEPEPQYSVEVVVSGSTAGRVEVSFQDTMQAGSSSPALPADSLPSSLVNVLELTPGDLTYEPNGSTQRYLLVFKVRQDYEFRPFHGNLRIAFSPGSEEAEGTTNTIGVVKNLLVTPFGWAGENPSEERTFSIIERNLLTAATKSGVIDRLFPDLPFLINQGPVMSSVRVTNPGVYPNNTWIEWRFFDGEELLAKKRIPDEFLRGGKSLDANFLVTYTDSSTDRTFDVLPTFRIIRYEVEVQSELSGFEYEPQVEVRHFVIAPWKEMLTLVLVSAFAFFVFRRVRRRVKLSPRGSRPTEEMVNRD
jgi:hypothetical protein